MSVWIDNLRLALADKPVILLHGNVRDRYIDRDGRVYENLTDLLVRLSMVLRADAGLEFSEICLFDPVKPERRLKPTGEEATPLSKESDTGEEGRPDQNVDPTRDIPLRRVLARWARELTKPGLGRFAILNYLDKAIPYKAAYSEDERQCLAWLEKIIENITANHRLVLVALQDTMFPVELYTSSPKCRVLPVVAPDREDRLAYLRYRLGSAHKQLQLIGDLTEGLYLRELDPIAAPIRNNADLTGREVRRIINRHRVGVEKDYWGEIELGRLDKADDWFIRDEGVKGQDEAVAKVVDVLRLARARLSGIASGTAAKPKGVLFFAGPTGVGKTFLAKKLAKFLFGTEEAFLRFDMSEFKEEHTVSKLIGSPPGYVGYERGGMLTNAVRERPFAVVLFDEIEKAHPKIMDLFLQILDEGRLTDSRGQTVFFTEALVVFTSNIGCRTSDTRGQATPERRELDEILNSVSPDAKARSERVREHFLRCVERFFMYEISRPELLNRIGSNIVPFNYIHNAATQRDIVTAHLRRIKEDFEDRYREEGFVLTVDPLVADSLVEKYGTEMGRFGGRGITNAIESELIMQLAPLVLCAEIEDQRGTTFQFTVSEGRLLVSVT